jgi:hypothetical protein
MASIDEQILRTTKEIVVKFIEIGRISPVGFDESFRSIYKTVSDAVPSEAKVSGKEKECVGKKKKGKK